jgi:hypothetical protein
VDRLLTRAGRLGRLLTRAALIARAGLIGALDRLLTGVGMAPRRREGNGNVNVPLSVPFRMRNDPRWQEGDTSVQIAFVLPSLRDLSCWGVGDPGLRLRLALGWNSLAPLGLGVGGGGTRWTGC